MTLSFIANVGADVVDLTPDYAKPGDTIDILSWNIVGPIGNTSLTWISVGYSGTNATSDMEYIQFYANNTLLGTVYQLGGWTLSPIYFIEENDTVTITMKIKIADTGVHGNHVDGYIVNYVLSHPGDPGTDGPADPAGYTIIDNHKPVVLSATAVPDPAKAGFVEVTVVFSETMNTGVSPSVNVTDLATDPYPVYQTSYIGNTWTGIFFLPPENEEKTATIAVGLGQDVAGNVMDTNSSAGTFEVDTIDPINMGIAVSDTLINEDDDGHLFNVTVTFSEAMDTAYTPDISFLPSVSTTLTSPSDAWSLGNTTYTVTYTIADANVEEKEVNVTVSGGKDPAGNPHALYKETDMFDVDTIAPTVVSATAVPDPAKAGFVEVTVVFSETMNTGVSPTVKVTGLLTTYTVNQDTFSGDTWIGNFTLLDQNEEKTTTIEVSGGKDLADNLMVANPNAGTFKADTIDPWVLSIEVSDLLITEADIPGTFLVNVTFSEAMDTGIIPIFDFNPSVSTTLKWPSGVWSSGNKTYTVTYTLADANVEEYFVDVNVSGGEDPAGNTHSLFTEYYKFGIDTLKPTVDEIVVSDKLINEDDDGDFFYVYVNFSEPMATIAPAIWFNPSVPWTLSFNGGVWDLGDKRYTANYTVTDNNVEKSAIDVSTVAYDKAGNVASLVVADMFDVDTIAPVGSVSVSDDKINEADIGGLFYVYATYSEPMNTTFTPDIGFTPDLIASGTLVFSGGAWSLSNTKYTVNYTVVDVNEETAYVNVTVGGAKDLAWNDQVPDPANGTALFYVDTAAPNITSISWSIDGMPVTIPETNITVTLIGDENFTATFDIVNVNSSILADNMLMDQGPLGTYTGNYTVKYGDDGTYLIDGYLVDDAGNIASILGTTNHPCTLYSVGNGTSEWSSDESHSGSYSVKLYVVNGTVDWAEVSIPVDIAIKDINTLSFWKKVASFTNGWNPNVYLCIDSDNDGDFDGDIPSYHQATCSGTSSADAATAHIDPDAFIALEFPTKLTVGDSNFIKVDALTMSAWAVDEDGNIPTPPLAYGDGLSQFQTASLGEIDPTDKVKKIILEIGGSGNWMNETAYVDDLKLNSVIYNFELPFKIDTVPPSVVSVTVSDGWITEADDGDLFNVTVTYSEDMNTTIDPSIVFDPDVSSTLIAPMNGAWVSSTVYKYTYTVDDADVEEEGVDINVTGAEDLAGKVQVNHTAPNKFKVDTLAPLEPTGLDAPEYINIANQTAYPVSGSAEVNTTVWIRLREGSNTVESSAFTSSGSFTMLVDASSLNDGIITIDANATDLAGNTGPYSLSISRRKDTVRPTVLGANTDPDPAKEGTVTVTVVFSDIMKTSVNPSVNVTDLTTDPYPVSKDTFSGYTWNGTFTLLDDNEEKTATISVSGGKDLADNPMLANTNAGTFEVDTKEPTVILSVSDDWITEADIPGTFLINATFSEPMNISVIPTIGFDSAAASTLTSPSGYWNKDCKTYTANYTLFDANVMATGIDVNVTGAKDEIGNSQDPDPTEQTDMFNIDTIAPTVDGIAVSDELINEDDDGDFFFVYVNFSEPMNTAVAPTISFNPDVTENGTLTSNIGSWDLGDTRYTANYTMHDVDEEIPDVDVNVTDAEDKAGNEDPLTEPDMFDVDTIAPTVVEIFVSDDYIKEDDIPGKFHVYVNFSEAMNVSKIPSILFEPGVSSTLENQTGAWSMDETDYTFTYDIADDDVEVYNVNVTVSGAEDKAGNPDPLKEEELFDIDTYHHIGEPEYIDMWAEYRPPMSITLNANEIAWPIESWYSEWNSPEYALESDDEFAFLTLVGTAKPDIAMILHFEDPPDALANYTITSVRLCVEQKLKTDNLQKEDWWRFKVKLEDAPLPVDMTINRPGTETETTLSIDISEGIPLEWGYVTNIETIVLPAWHVTPMAEWYIDNVWIEVNCVYEDEGPSITIPVDDEAAIYAYVTDAFGDPVPETEVSFETIPIGTVDPVSNTTDGKAETTLTSKEIGTATVTATAGEVEGNCNVTFVARTLEIELSQGWNLISVPRELENSMIETVFDGTTPIEKVYTYQDGNWFAAFYNGTDWINPISEHPIDDIDDGKGYWIYTSEQTTVTISLKLLGFTGVPPPEYTLTGGWNMIGYTSMQLEPETPINVYLTSLEDKWVSLHKCTPKYDTSNPLDIGFNFELGIGYWIYLNAPGALVP